MNWTREQLKSNAKLMVKKNWVLCAVVSFILILIGGNSSPRVNVNYSGAPDDMAMSGLMSTMGGDWVFLVQRMMPLLAGVMVIVMVLAIALNLLVGNPLQVGGARFYLHNIHSRGVFEDLGFAFSSNYKNVVMVMLVRMVYIWLWSLLLIIPGIIKTYEYRMVPYLLADNPELSSNEALSISRDMMYGEKMNAFILDLSFILWYLLTIFTFGIAGYVWVYPYRDATNAELYMALCAKNPGGR